MRKLLDVLREKYNVSTRALKRAIDAKKCRVNGRITTVSTMLVKPSDRIEIDLTPSRATSLPILYEDDYLLVCNKPPFLLCDNKTINAKLPQFKGTLLLIHRLDKETSGVLLIAKTRAMLTHMISLFRKKEVRKIYLAIVDGKVERKEGAIESLVKGLHAKTLWKCLKRCNTASLVECTLITGRTHQLRIHLAELGHPILGDVFYGGQNFICPYAPPRNLLHAQSIAFVHPFTHASLEFKAPIPQDFTHALSHC